MTVTPERVDIVLVALDGSSFAARAVEAGRRLALSLRAAVELYSVVPDPETVERREELLARLRPRDLPSEFWVEVDAQPADAIDRVLEQLDNAVPCLASHGSRLRNVVTGSVITALLRRRSEPTIVVSAGFDTERTGSGVVACIDDDPSIGVLIRAATHWSGMLGEPCSAVTVAETLPPPLVAGPPRRAFGPNVGDVEGFVRHVVAANAPPGAEIEPRAVYDPISPSGGMRRYLLDHPPALVAVGSHLHPVFGRQVLGRNAAAILRQSTAPVLTVPLP